jgi:hypothetical protein
MKIGDLVAYYDSFELKDLYGIVLRKDANCNFIVFWFDDYKTSEEGSESTLKIIGRHL